jgi:hypothetical protein
MATEAKDLGSIRTMSTETAPTGALNPATLPNLSKEEIARYSPPSDHARSRHGRAAQTQGH